jgi:heme A synthase
VIVVATLVLAVATYAWFRGRPDRRRRLIRLAIASAAVLIAALAVWQGLIGRWAGALALATAAAFVGRLAA